MILLDTNIVSGSMRVEPDTRLIDWMDRQRASSLFLSAVSVDEIVFGIGHCRLADAETTCGVCSPTSPTRSLDGSWPSMPPPQGRVRGYARTGNGSDGP